jgi:hypothetical protein
MPLTGARSEPDAEGFARRLDGFGNIYADRQRSMATVR